jgi:hypothetical protein
MDVVQNGKTPLKHTPYSLLNHLNGKTHFRKCGPSVLIKEKDHAIVAWTLVI